MLAFEAGKEEGRTAQAKHQRIDSCALVEVIKIEFIRGRGIDKEDPIRVVTQYWSATEEPKLLAEHDAMEGGKMKSKHTEEELKIEQLRMQLHLEEFRRAHDRWMASECRRVIEHETNPGHGRPRRSSASAGFSPSSRSSSCSASMHHQTKRSANTSATLREA